VSIIKPGVPHPAAALRAGFNLLWLGGAFQYANEKPHPFDLAQDTL